jgi:hypothetical protein
MADYLAANLPDLLLWIRSCTFVDTILLCSGVPDRYVGQ